MIDRFGEPSNSDQFWHNYSLLDYMIDYFVLASNALIIQDLTVIVVGGFLHLAPTPLAVLLHWLCGPGWQPVIKAFFNVIITGAFTPSRPLCLPQ